MRDVPPFRLALAVRHGGGDGTSQCDAAHELQRGPYLVPDQFLCPRFGCSIFCDHSVIAFCLCPCTQTALPTADIWNLHPAAFRNAPCSFPSSLLASVLETCLWLESQTSLREVTVMWSGLTVKPHAVRSTWPPNIRTCCPTVNGPEISMANMVSIAEQPRNRHRHVCCCGVRSLDEHRMWGQQCTWQNRNC